MNSKDELQKHVDDTEKILLLAIMYFKDTIYLSNPQDSMEKVMVQKYPVFQRVKYSLWVLTVLELCKLFIDRDNDKYNLHKFLNKLLDNYKNIEWKHAMDKSIIHGFKQRLNVDCKPIIDKIEKLRDKLYAHTDKDIEDLISSLRINYTEIDSLMDLAKKILFTIKSKYFDIHTDFNISGLERFNYVLVNLSKYEDYYDKEIKEKMKG
jgi:hypothetical protein